MKTLQERNQKQRSFFNEKIACYDETHAPFMESKKTLAENLDADAKHILDLGVGTGLELIRLFELFPNAKVTAIDISENMLQELQKRDFSKNINRKCGDFFEVDFGKNYDAVISTSALHHFKEEEKEILYKKVLDCLKPNGQFLNCDKIAFTQEAQENCLFELENNFENYKHIDTPLTIENEIKILQKIGFQNITTTLVNREDYRLFKSRK